MNRHGSAFLAVYPLDLGFLGSAHSSGMRLGSLRLHFQSIYDAHILCFSQLMPLSFVDTSTAELGLSLRMFFIPPPPPTRVRSHNRCV